MNAKRRNQPLKPLGPEIERLFGKYEQLKQERDQSNQPRIPEWDGATCRLPCCDRPPREGRRLRLSKHKPFEGYETCSVHCAHEFALILRQELAPPDTPLSLWRQWGRWVGLEMDLTREEFIRQMGIHRIVKHQHYEKGPKFTPPQEQ